MAIIQKPDALSMLGNLKKFIITSGSQVVFELKEGSTVLFSATYESGIDGRATIDVKDIIENRLKYIIKHDDKYEQTNIVKTFTATIDGIVNTFKVIRTGVANLQDTPTNWLRSNFLSWQPQNKKVTYYSPEWLTYYAQEACDLKLKAYFPDDTVQNFNLGACEAGKAFTFNLQYALIAGKLGQIYPTHFDVWAENSTGTRLTYIQRYLYSDPLSEQEQWFLFENSLGGLDTIRAYGDSDFTGNHEHKLSSVDDTSSEYDVDTERTYNKNTGYLDNYERQWLLDFFVAKQKYIYHSAAIRSIVLKDSDVKYNASDLPSEFNFTYKFSDAESSVLLNLIRSENIPAQITIPNLDSPDFHLPPRLSEYPRVPLHEGVILPAFDPNSEDPKVTTIGAILSAAVAKVLQSIEAGEGGGELVSILRSADPEAPSDYNVFSSLRTLLEIRKYFNENLGDIDKKYLRKDIEDTAQKTITFLEGIVAKGDSEIEELTVKGEANLEKGFKTKQGHGVDVDGLASLKHINLEDGFQSPEFIQGLAGEGVRLSKKEGTRNQYVLELQDLIVNGKLNVHTIEVLEWKHVGAGQIFSHAGFRIDRVVELEDRYRVFPEKPEMNTFQVNSQALCQQFTEGDLGKRYWRLVVGVASDRSYIELSKSVAEAGSDIPEEGDSIFAYGYRGLNNALKGAVVISSYGESGPYIQTLRGIDSFDVSGKTQIFIGDETHFRVNRFEVQSGSGDFYRVPADKGRWSSGTTAYYYDRYSHDGSLWLCVAQPSTTDEPSIFSVDWERQVSRGEDGGTGYRVERFSTPGYEFYREGQEYSHTLAIKVFYNEVDVSETISASRFVWTRISENTAGDEVWNDLHLNSGASVDITSADLAGDTSFIVQFYDESKTKLIGTINF